MSGSGKEGGGGRGAVFLQKGLGAERVFSFRLHRSELSVEKTSVLQSELESCNQLQELEPLNKCKVSVCVCVFDLVLSDYAVVRCSFPRQGVC